MSKKKRLYWFEFIEELNNGEAQYTQHQLIKAIDKAQAKRKADKFIRNFYGDKPEKLEEGVYEFFGGQIILQSGGVQETTRAEFAEHVTRQCTYDSGEDISKWHWERL